MGFITDGVQAALDLSLDRVRRNQDHGQFNPRPATDPKQQSEFLDEARGGRTDELYRQCLEFHGFRWYEPGQLPMLEGSLERLSSIHRSEGEWRHATLKLGFTPTDLASGFPKGPESLDTYIRDEKLKAKVQQGKVAQSDLRKSRLRR